MRVRKMLSCLNAADKEHGSSAFPVPVVISESVAVCCKGGSGLSMQRNVSELSDM